MGDFLWFFIVYQCRTLYNNVENRIYVEEVILVAHLGQAPVKKGPQFIFRLVTKTFFLLALFLGLTAGVGYNQYVNGLKPVASDHGAEIKLTVPTGATTGQIADLLKEKGLIKNSFIFRVYARLHRFDGKLKAGNYTLNTSMSLPQIMSKITGGSVEYITFTIPEGFNTRQIADRLAAKNLINKEVFFDLVANGDFDYDFLNGLPNNEKRLEGYLFPDTYKVTATTTEREIIDMMLARFAREATPEFRQKAQKLGLTLHQAVTLASIVEREAKVDKERPKVAAVFLNRMKKGWKLESCATVQYALGQPKARLLNKDLQIDSPYNTYKYSGLPPTPIASPGRASLQAAVNPANVDYLFFVVSQDGRHVFSRTLAEHNRAKAKYIKETFND
ncbi:aminodeoxychorismate lyase [Thermincola ferriacetica]|uniref:Endolytic murein transglycosylase n=1 Tax=Thermincola ferriacetica TaxID=281456 RepID=A0A0L6W3T7_9FIRM|nr:endolytic transglycosylase MltG [Thermincola ferriacetica]KNZ70200.1 aminodeoxychorismate lyase [Thermincola ferriacetica]